MTVKNRKRPLRSGYTTGACAAAAAGAAAAALLNQQPVSRIAVDLRDGRRGDFHIKECWYDARQAACAVIKDAGDDPDITDGAEIAATVAWADEPGIIIEGGEGVGRVTKPGLEVAIGRPAINPVPLAMIAQAVSEALRGNDRGVKVTVSVTGGEKLAKKTLNPRLGIVGGISILGTTGVVIPYSVDAYQACISQSLDIAAACGCRQAVLTTGRRSEKYAQAALALPEECFVQAGDFIGFSLKECVRAGMEKAIIWGMTGKISKLAAGHLYTNISDSKVDMSFLAGVARDCGVPDDMMDELKKAATANHFRKLLPAACAPYFCDALCRLAAEKCRASTGGKLTVECVMSSYDGVPLGRGAAGG